MNLLVTGGSDEEVYEGEDLEFEEEIGYIKVFCYIDTINSLKGTE